MKKILKFKKKFIKTNIHFIHIKPPNNAIKTKKLIPPLKISKIYTLKIEKKIVFNKNIKNINEVIRK